MNEKLTVAILSKNAEKHITLCLESVKWADEIIVLDGYSTDATCDIARSFGAKVIQKKFEGFPAERTYVMNQASNDWILSVDTDMAVPTALATEIKALLARGPECDGYFMRCLNHFMGREIRHCTWFNYRFLMFFNRKKVTYNLADRVLDNVICHGKVGKLNNYLVHHQTESLEEYLQKMTRMFAPLTADEYIAKGVRIRPWNIPWYFCVRPGLIFTYKYFIRLGILDGIPGLLICVNSALLYYFIFSIIWDRQKGTPQYNLRKYLSVSEDKKVKSVTS